MDSPLVIARGFWGKQLKRVAMQAENGLIYVASPARLEAVEKGDSHPVGSRRKTYSISTMGFLQRLNRNGTPSNPHQPSYGSSFGGTRPPTEVAS